MRSLRINRLLPIYISTLPLKFGVDIQSQSKVSPETKKSNMAARRPCWKWRRWKSIGSYPYIYVLCHLSLQLIFKAKLKLESGNQKFQYGCLAAILKLTLLKINRLLHIYISIVPLKFGVDIQSQTKVRVWKPKYPIWPPGGHFESDINRLLPMTTINMHMKFEIEISKQTWLTTRKPCHLQSPETEKSNMAARRPFWKWRCWKSIGSYPYT